MVGIKITCDNCTYGFLAGGACWLLFVRVEVKVLLCKEAQETDLRGHLWAGKVGGGNLNFLYTLFCAFRILYYWIGQKLCPSFSVRWYRKSEQNFWPSQYNCEVLLFPKLITKLWYKDAPCPNTQPVQARYPIPRVPPSCLARPSLATPGPLPGPAF